MASPGTATTSRGNYRPWTDGEIKFLIENWAADVPIPDICKALNREYSQISMKAFHLGLPSRRKPHGIGKATRQEDLLEIDEKHPSYKFLDFSYTPAELEAALDAIYAPPKPRELIQNECRRCQRLTLFETRFQRWCQPCRDEMSNIITDDLW